MEHILNSHGAFAFMLLGLCGGVAGIKAGLWAFGIVCLVSMPGLFALALWEQRCWFVRTRYGRYLLGSLPSVLSMMLQRKITSPPSPAS